MRKGIVMEQKNECTIVMTSDGCFHRARRLDKAEIGMEVHFQLVTENKKIQRWTQIFPTNHTKVAVIALALLLAFFPLYSLYGSNQAYAYVNVDINPSVELKLNDKMQVLNIYPKNKEAEEILSMLKGWKKKDASKVTFDMIRLSQEKGYVNSKNQVLIGISYVESDEMDDFSKQIEDYLHNQSPDLSIATFLVPDQLRKKAHETNQSVNEFMAARLKNKSETEKHSSNPVTIEDADKEIIQSFYKESKSSVEQKDSEETPTPEVQLEEQTDGKPGKTHDKQKNPSENNTVHQKPGKHRVKAPGQIKKQTKPDSNQPRKEKSNQDSSAKNEKNDHTHHHKNKRKSHSKGKNKHKNHKDKHHNHSNKHIQGSNQKHDKHSQR